MTEQTRPTSTSHGIGTFLIVLFPIMLAFSLSQFFRSAQALLAEPLRTELAVSPEQLGLIAGSFHFGFALMQIPVGVMLDRYGPRKTNGVMMAFALLGVIIFANAQSVYGLMAGQAVIGLGCSAAFMSALMLAARWTAPEKFAAASGLIVAFSLLGVLASATDLCLQALYSKLERECQSERQERQTDRSVLYDVLSCDVCEKIQRYLVQAYVCVRIRLKLILDAETDVCSKLSAVQMIG